MTQEEKAKAYDEALALMVDCVPDEDGLVHVRPHEIFSELTESEDERIRKELIGFLRNIPNSNYTCEEMAAWLEKQGEQKSVLDELEMTLSVSEDAYLRSNIEKLIKELKEDEQ